MWLSALACDYDGTLASADRVLPETWAALARAREAGLHLILVTGRTFFELTRVCEHLDLFEAVVAENGAVLYFPPVGTIRDQAPSPSPRLLAELDRRGVVYQAGRVVVGTARTDEPAVRAALAAAGMRLDLVPNRGALMLLPAGLSKGTGVRAVIRALGLSFHDVLAIGDAENDLDLLEACGIGACPADAVPALRERADWVLPGDDGLAVAQAVLGPILAGRLPPGRAPWHRVELGWAVGSFELVALPARGVSALIHGDPLSGKSWLAGSLVERLLGHRYAVCVVDPEGDFGVLAELPGVAWMQVRDEGAATRLLGRLEHDPEACVVADLSVLSHDQKLRAMAAILSAIRHLRDHLGRPHWVVLDEAHYSLYRGGITPAAAGLAHRGFCLVTYRPSWLEPEVMAAVDLLLLGRSRDRAELRFLRTALGADAGPVLAVLPDLPPGQFLLLRRTDPAGPGATTFVAAPRRTAHVRHLRKYADTRVAPHEHFFFRGQDGRVVATADSLASFRAALGILPDAVLAPHAARGDFSRWVADVFSDTTLGAQIRKTETRFSRGDIADLRQALSRLIALRYGADR